MNLDPSKNPKKPGASPNRIQAYFTQSIPPPTRRITQSSQEHPRFIREGRRSLLPEDEQQILTVNCMNCQELISIEKIEDHSKFCTTIPESVITLESGSYLSQIIFKLKRLESCLMDLSKNPELRPGDKNYITIFLRLSRKIIESNSIEQTDSVINSLSSLLVTFKGSLSIRVYADRLQTLVQEQKLGLQEMEIEGKKQELEKIKEEVEKYKNRSSVLTKTLLKTTPGTNAVDLNRKLEEITSDVGTIFSGSSEPTVFSGVEDEKIEMEIPASVLTDDLQKHFYALCLSIKTRTVGKVKSQNISIQKLYNEALEHKIPPDSWPDFITNQLKNPAKWTDDRSRRRFQPKNPAMKKEYFEVIVEEDIA